MLMLVVKLEVELVIERIGDGASGEDIVCTWIITLLFDLAFAARFD
jgi:hypothetical protein